MEMTCGKLRRMMIRRIALWHILAAAEIPFAGLLDFIIQNIGHNVAEEEEEAKKIIREWDLLQRNYIKTPLLPAPLHKW